MNLCVLLTVNYPFGKGETFLENEISYISEGFDKVIILASSAAEDAPQTRSTPPNVSAYPLGEIRTKLRYPIYSLNGILQMPSDERKEMEGLPLKKRLGCYYISGRERAGLRKATAILDRVVPWKDVGSCVFYSYWLTDSALVAGRLKIKYASKVNGNVRAVSRAHGYDLYASRNPLGYIPYRDLQFSMLDLVAPCSEDGVAYLVGEWPQYSQKIKCHRLGTKDMGMCTKEKESDTVHIVTCSNIIPLKRVSLIAEAVIQLNKEGLDVKWTCIGDGSELEKIKHSMHEACMDDKVDFKGRISNIKVYKFLKTNYVDVFVNASTSEGLPVSIMEAMSFGVPCVATDVGGTGELVNDDCGCLLPSDIDAAKIANAVKDVVSRVRNGEPFRANARKCWKELVSEDNYIKWVAVLEGSGFHASQIN